MKTKKKLTGCILAFGAPDNTADIRYIAGFTSSDPAAFVKVGKEKYLIVGALDAAKAAAGSSCGKVYSIEEAVARWKSERTFIAVIIALLRRSRVRCVNVAADFPVGCARELELAGLRVNVLQGTVFPGREVKRPDEIEKIVECQHIAGKAMKMATGMIARAGIDRRGRLVLDGSLLTAEGLRRAIDIELLKHDCAGGGTIVACGKDSVEPHGVGFGPLLAGECIVLDIFPRSLTNGYWGDMTRTVVKGPPCRKIRRMYEAVKAAQAAAFARIRSGVSAVSVHNAAVKAMEERGFETGKRDGRPEGFIHGTGHGVGVGIHEPPRIGRAPGRLKAGHVVTVEPGLYYHDVGGMRIEDLVVVTADGWRCLGNCGKKLEV